MNKKERPDGESGVDMERNHRGRHAPSERELLILVAVSLVTLWITAFVLHGSAGLVRKYGDNDAYLKVTSAILRWDFNRLDVQHFMGYPYCIALISRVLHLPAAVALWLVAVVSAFVSTWLVARLFGTTVAGYFAFTNFSWLQAAFVGGSEPLAMALGLGALAAFRRDRIFLAASLGSLAVTVRPLMIFILVGIGLVLLVRKQFADFLIALGTGLAIGTLYVLPLAIYLGDLLQTVHSYTRRDYGGAGIAGPHGQLFGWPFHGIVAGTIAYPAPWTNLVLSFFWIGLVLAGVAMMFSRRFREYAQSHANEAIFCGLYLFATFSYDYLIWARSNFIRFAIPALPFVFYALLPFLPKDRRILWVLSIVSAVLAMFSVVGVRNVMGHG